jgi:hypothetical protein
MSPDEMQDRGCGAVSHEGFSNLRSLALRGPNSSSRAVPGIQMEPGERFYEARRGDAGRRMVEAYEAMLARTRGWKPAPEDDDEA